MKIPSISDIIGDLQSNDEDLEIEDVEFGDPENTNVTTPVITTISAVVNYFKSSVTNQPYAKITWTWVAPVMLDEDGLVMNPLDPEIADDVMLDPVTNYMFGTSLDGVVPIGFASSKGATTVTTTNHPIGSNVTLSVYAVTKSGLIGPVATYTVGITKDTTPPSIPNAPVVSAYLGALIVRDNNKTNTGTNMPVDTAYKEVQVSVDGTTWVTVGRISGAGTVTLSNLPYGVLHYFRFVAYDFSSNASTASATTTGTPRQLVEADVGLGEIKAYHIGAHQIQANHLEATMILSTEIYLGPPTDNNLRLDPTGLARSRYDADAETIVEAFHLGGNTPDWLQFRGIDGTVTASIDEDGAAVFQSIDTDTLQIAGQTIQDLIAQLPRGLKGWTKWTADSPHATSTADVAYIEFRSNLEANRSYRIRVSSNLIDTTVAGNIFQGQVRVAYDGSTVSTSSTLLDASPAIFETSSTSTSSAVSYDAILSTAGQVTALREARFLYCVSRYQGTGDVWVGATSTLPVYCTIEDIGPAVAQSTAVAARQSVWMASSSRAYSGTNVQRTDATYLNYSNTPLTTGNCLSTQNWSQIVFTSNAISGETGSTIAVAIASATVSKAEIYLFAQYADVDSGVQFQIRANTSTALSTTPPSGTGITVTIKPGTGKWVDITSIWDPTKRGIWISSALTTDTGHGHIRSAVHTTVNTRPQLRLEYRR